MIEDYDGLELSTKVLIQASKNRGIKVDILDMDDNFIRLEKDGKVEYVKQATITSADTYITPMLMANKVVTKVVLDQNGIRVPMGSVAASIEQGKKELEYFDEKAVVIKPKSTNFGQGVVVLAKDHTREQGIRALEQAFTFDSHVLLEEFIQGKEYRILVIDDKVVAILYRIPANVTGDGTHTIRQLVEEKNSNPLRGVGHVTPLEKIAFGTIESDVLAAQGLTFDSVANEGEKVFLRENSNVSTGGDSIDFTDKIHEGYHKLAIKAAQSARAKICGVDMMIEDIDVPPTKDNYGIIEINFNPAIYMHDYPVEGKNRRVEESVLDLLGF